MLLNIRQCSPQPSIAKNRMVTNVNGAEVEKPYCRGRGEKQHEINDQDSISLIKNRLVKNNPQHLYGICFGTWFRLEGPN